MKRLLLFLLMIIAGLLSSCSLWQQKNKTHDDSAKPRIPPPRYLGSVQQVYPSQKFALLRIIGPLPSAGTTLITHPADGSTSRMGNLIVSSDATPRNGMLVADIRSGSLQSGDRVFLYRNIALPDATNTQTNEQPPAPQDSDAETLRPAVADEPVQPRPSIPTVTPLDMPTPEQEPTSAEQESVAPTQAESDSHFPALPAPPSAPPAYLRDIPDDLSEWN